MYFVKKISIQQVHRLIMTSSDTEGVLTVVDDWEPDLVDKDNSRVYRKGRESNNNIKDTKAVANAMHRLVMDETAKHKPQIEGTASTYFDEILCGIKLCIKSN